ncbi:cytochrome C551 [Bacillus sp. MUM 116]|uniref:cytochrome c551 n=1 Tax=Bacillus sp. MUM 116 TaxID=1678002 RepID=UPI0008F559E5|nr:cytochrome c [Bacillus sp. MUM 116]OIK16361.1 cytochrome C551 [Bacillus sp. MUM 116]
MKKKLLTLLLGTSLVMGLAACGGGTDTSKNKDTTTKTTDTGGGANDVAAAAEKITAQKCSSCHGENLKGAVGPDLTHIGAQLSKQQILDILKNGKSGGMPKGLISGDDADKVATWLASKK